MQAIEIAVNAFVHRLPLPGSESDNGPAAATSENIIITQTPDPGQPPLTVEVRDLPAPRAVVVDAAVTINGIESAVR